MEPSDDLDYVALTDRDVAAQSAIGWVDVLSVFEAFMDLLLNVEIHLGPAVGVFLDDLHDCRWAGA